MENIQDVWSPTDWQQQQLCGIEETADMTPGMDSLELEDTDTYSQSSHSSRLSKSITHGVKS